MLNPLQMSSLPAGLPAVAELGALSQGPGEVEGTASAKPFQQLLLSAFQDAQQADSQAQAAIAGGLVEGDLTQVEVFTALKKADLALRTLVQIRNRLMEAYQEVQQMRM